MKLNLNILLISSAQPLISLMASCVAQIGHQLDVIDCVEAFEDEYTSNLDLCLIDTGQVRDSAFELTSRLRDVHPSVGLISILPQHDLSMRIQAWQSGADQVFCQPLEQEEFVPMLRQLSNRLKMPSGLAGGLNSDEMKIALSSHKRSIKGALAEIALTSTEYVLLQSLARAKNKSLELWQIYDLLGKTEETLQKPAIEAQLYRLRKKLRDCGAGNQALKSIRLRGYQLCVPIWIS